MSVRRRTYSLLGGWLMSGELLYCGLSDDVASGGYSIFHLTDKNISDYFNDNYALWVSLNFKSSSDYDLGGIDSFVAVYSDFTKSSSSNKYYLNFINSNYSFYINLDDNSCQCKYSFSSVSIGVYRLLLIAIPRTDV